MLVEVAARAAAERGGGVSALTTHTPAGVFPVGNKGAGLLSHDQRRVPAASQPAPINFSRDEIPTVDPWAWEFQRIRRAWEVYRLASEPLPPPSPRRTVTVEVLPPAKVRGSRVVCVERPEWGVFRSMRHAAMHQGVAWSRVKESVYTGVSCGELHWRREDDAAYAPLPAKKRAVYVIDGRGRRHEFASVRLACDALGQTRRVAEYGLSRPGLAHHGLRWFYAPRPSSAARKAGVVA